jgi:hypothetical protein
MNLRTVRAAAAALVIGTAVLGATAASAQTSVSKEVGAAYNEAKALTAQKRYREAMQRLDSAPAKTAGERAVIEQMKQYVAIQSGDASIGGALGAKAKFAQDAAAGRWDAVIAGGDALRKAGALDAQSMVVIAQAYYRKNDPKGCMRYIRSNLGAGAGGESGLQLLQRCAYDAGDLVAERQALEQLVGRTGKPEYWSQLLRLAQRGRGLTDQNTLDIYRLKSMTGSLTTADEAMTYAQIALVRQMPAEAIAVIDQSTKAKIMPANDRTARLLKLATDRNAEANAGAAKALAAANAAPNGDALVAVGQQQVSQGKAKDGVASIRAGIAKKPTNVAEAQLRLGAALLADGQKAEAVRAFNAVKGSEQAQMIAGLYAIYARR